MCASATVRTTRYWPRCHGSSGATRNGMPALFEGADYLPLVEQADHLVDGGISPDVVHGRAEHGREGFVGPLLGLLGSLTRPWGTLVPPDPVLVVDRRPLQVVVDQLEVPREESDHRDRLKRLP